MKRKNIAHDLVVESITQALLELMEQKPFGEITVSELCDRAGVSRISFYRNYSSMPDILVQYLGHCTDAWWEEFIKKPREAWIRDFWPELLQQYRNHALLIRLLYQNDITYILKEHIFSCCGPKEDQDERMAYTCAMLAGLIYGLVDEWIRRGMTDFPEGLGIDRMIAIAREGGLGRNEMEGK